MQTKEKKANMTRKIYIPINKMPWRGGNYYMFDIVKLLTDFNIEVYFATFNQFCEQTAQYFKQHQFNHIHIADGTPFPPEENTIIFLGESEKYFCETLGANHDIVMFNQNPFYTLTTFPNIEDLDRLNLRKTIVPSLTAKNLLARVNVTQPMDILYTYLPDYFSPPPPAAW